MWMHCYTIIDYVPPPLLEEVEGCLGKEKRMRPLIYNIAAKLISDPEWQQKEIDY
jgi:hypothetical protein